MKTKTGCFSKHRQKQKLKQKQGTVNIKTKTQTIHESHFDKTSRILNATQLDKRSKKN